MFLIGVFQFISVARADECRHRIIFYPQTHATDKLHGAQRSESQQQKIAASQLKVANFIEGLPDVPVFTEQAGHQDFSLDTLSKDKVIALKQFFDQVFPNGLPNDSSMLSDIQRQKLVNNGGDFVQLIRGRTKILHRVAENKESIDEIFVPIKRWFETHPSRDASYPPEIGALVYGAREKAALLQIQNYFSKNPRQKDVILIYGSNHNFNFYPDQFPPQCITIPSDFQPDWGGQFRSGPQGFPSPVQKQKTDYQKPAKAMR